MDKEKILVKNGSCPNCGQKLEEGDIIDPEATSSMHIRGKCSKCRIKIILFKVASDTEFFRAGDVLRT